MTNVDITRATEIVTLHNQIGDYLKSSLLNAQRIGELLTEQKASMQHGEFGPWINENLPFTDRTARNYMTLHKERARLKTENVSDLTGAYKLLKASTWSTLIEEVKKWETDFDAAFKAVWELYGEFNKVIHDPLVTIQELKQVMYYAGLVEKEATACKYHYWRLLGKDLIEREAAQ